MCMGCACDFALNGLNVPPKKKKRNFLSTEDFVCREIWICILGRLAGFRPNPALNPPKSAYQTAPKVNEDFYNRTLSGGLITIISSIAILLLFISEIICLNIEFDVTFPSLACSLLSVDAMDISSERHFDIRHDIVKKRLDHLGKVIDSRKGDIGAPQPNGRKWTAREEEMKTWAKTAVHASREGGQDLELVIGVGEEVGSILVRLGLATRMREKRGGFVRTGGDGLGWSIGPWILAAQGGDGLVLAAFLPSEQRADEREGDESPGLRFRAREADDSIKIFMQLFNTKN
ncbi:hypothetical protein MA16_Dca025274 [Dendrobium catenatum]|uniref:Endoplasmic reticulum vesicle transporter N-terminal domain-containing protein n=1 Tax=Dendrobium catenatum TaxID=906689 RepID=A0A2I0WN92_9ASPA|nr:hypothetical protein MA16_Dca025274 [Dendrobium catenatum]